MSYTHLNTFEQGKIKTLHKLGYSGRKITTELNRHHSTILRQLKRLNERNKRKRIRLLFRCRKRTCD